MRNGRNVARQALSLMLLVTIVLMAAAPVYAQDAEDSQEAQQVEGAGESTDWGGSIFDVIVLRPCQAVAVVIGAGLFVPAALISSPGGRPALSDAWDVFVAEPADTAFYRPLGDF